MTVNLGVSINNQPDSTTCGPTSLYAVYEYYGDTISLDQVIEEVNQFDEGGGTLAVVLGMHALSRGYDVTIISYNINIFDPSWFEMDMEGLRISLETCAREETCSLKHVFALNSYIQFLKYGGQLHFQDLSETSLKETLNDKVPILTGLSSTWLYRDTRENPFTNEYDAIEGEPAGHFVVLNGHTEDGQFLICDPYHKNPFNNSTTYQIDGTRLINSILLGVSSYDGNLLLIKKKVKTGFL